MRPGNSRIVGAIVLSLLALPLCAETEVFALTVGGEAGALGDGPFAGPAARFSVGSELFRAAGELRFVGDGKWYPTESWMPVGYYFDLREASISSRQGPFLLEGGYLAARHYVSRNPFAQLLDSRGKGAVGAALTYDGERFVYQSRWVSVNRDSIHDYGYGREDGGLRGTAWKDRGLNHKLYLLKFGRLRLGYQESSLFLGRDFDANYFLSPAPSIFTNTLWSKQLTPNPWVTDTNDSSYMGFYGDWESDTLRVEGELIIKDVNLPFGYPDNVNKLAWSAGLSWSGSWGRLSLWHGGATKHMYAATYETQDNPNVYPYEYTYYPQDIVAGRTIALEDNYIGYRHGENSLAFRLDWEGAPAGILPPWMELRAGAEWVLSGSKSPHNPWHELAGAHEIDAKTELLNGEAALESRLRAELAPRITLGKLYIEACLVLGAVINPLELTHTAETIAASEHPIWKPKAGGFAWDNQILLRAGWTLRI